MTSYRGGGHSNNSGGAAQPKRGTHYTPLSRAAGYSSTMAAMGSKTRSQHQHTSKHYRYEDAGDGQGGNCVGYSPE